MTIHIRAHFDGRVLIPDQPVDLPINQPLEVEVTTTGSNGSNGKTLGDAATIQDRQRRLHAGAGIFSALVLSDEALQRENLYDDRL